MRLWCVVLLLLVPISVLAAEESGWYYRDEGFVLDGVNYTVISNDPDRLLLAVDGRTKLIPMGECIKESSMEYCFTDTGYPSDDDHIVYRNGEELYENYLAVRSIEAELNVDQELQDDAQLGQAVAVIVSIENVGDYPIQQFTYEVAIPSGLRTSDGATTVKIVKPSVSVGVTEAMTFRLTPIQYGTFSLSPHAWYTFNGKVHNVSLSSFTIDIDSPLTMERSLNKTLSLDQKGTYRVNLTNDGEETMSTHLVIVPPAGILVDTIKGVIKKDGALVADITLKEDEEQGVWFTYQGITEGDQIIPLRVEMDVDGTKSTYAYNDTVDVSLNGITAALKLAPDRSGFTAGEQMTIKGVLTNTNGNLRFKQIKGTLSAPGILSSAVPFGHEEFGEGKTLTEVEHKLTLPQNITSTTNITITLSGTYQSPAGLPLSYTTKRTIQIVPSTRDVRLSRSVSPQNPAPGDTVSVQVTAENVASVDHVVDAHEKIEGANENLQGETYKSTTVRAGQTQQLYAYTFMIPSNSTEKSLLITTNVREESAAAPIELVTTLPIRSVQEVPDSKETTETPTEEAIVEETEELGFFAAIADFFKKLFD